MSNHVDMMKRKTRRHPGLEWADTHLVNYGFHDINQVALDDRYGKVGAPLSKRRNGTGPAGRDAPPGLFGGLKEAMAPFESWAKERLTPSNIILTAVLFSAVAYHITQRKE